MGVQNRQIRIIVIAVAFSVVLFVLFDYHNDPAGWTKKYGSIFGEQFQRMRLPDPIIEGQNGQQPMPLVSHAHKLPTADEFRNHLAAVTAVEGMTMAEAKSGCHWDADQFVNFQYSETDDWVAKERSDKELARRRQEWQYYIKNRLIPWWYVRERFSGRGIVILAGNGDTLMRVKVVLRALLKIGSTIPVEIHYWRNEMNEGSIQELIDMYPPGMYFNDLSGAHNIIHSKKDGFFGVNYQLKPAAVLNSRFAELLLLDSDNIPTVPPETLFDSMAYQEYHSVFWPDIARTRPQNPVWAITNTACKMNEYEQESGQLLVDKARFWYHLQLASWFTNEKGSYYNKFLLGDKDVFRFAWHALKTEYGKPKKWLASVGTVNDGNYCGNSFAQHHPDDERVAFVHGGLFKTAPPEVLRWNREHGGMFRDYKRSPTDEQPEVSINVAIKWDGADYVPNHTDKFHAPSCTDMFDVEPRGIDEVLPGFEQTFGELGGYWEADQPES